MFARFGTNFGRWALEEIFLEEGGSVTPDHLLLEDGSDFLLEDGTLLLLE